MKIKGQNEKREEMNASSETESLKIPDHVIIRNLIKENKELLNQLEQEKSERQKAHKLSPSNRLVRENNKLRKQNAYYYKVIFEPNTLCERRRNLKLPEEAQKIIKFYTDFPYRNGTDLMMIFTGMIQELAPFLSNDFLPAYITDLSHLAPHEEIAKNLSNSRKADAVDGLPSRAEILETLSRSNS